MKLIIIFIGVIMGSVNIESSKYQYDKQGRPIPPTKKELNIKKHSSCITTFIPKVC